MIFYRSYQQSHCVFLRKIHTTKDLGMILESKPRPYRMKVGHPFSPSNSFYSVKKQFV
jgi:hypothetical protein